MARSKKSTMSDDHKAALAVGRNESRAVRLYLEALEANRPKRGRKRSTETMQARLESIDADIATADPLRRVKLIQEKLDLETALGATEDAVDLSELEAGFIQSAKGYSERKGISYAAWRQLGIAPAVLREAGISRSS
jgi:hypothetical protein